MVSIVVIMSRDDVDVDLHIFLLFQCFTMDSMQTQEGQSCYAPNTVVSLLMICELWSVRMVGNGSINES